MKVSFVKSLDDKFDECDITTDNENFYVKAGHKWLLIHNSPSLIFGWRGNEFVLTDKAGFSAKGYDGMTTSRDAIEQMILNRKTKDTSDSAQAARRRYARTIAALYPVLKNVVPRSFKGFAQGDLLWTSTPPLVDGAYEFKPVKIKYRVPMDSELGKTIGASQVGMVIHSVYNSQQDQEPNALRNVKDLGFRETDGLVILPHELDLQTTFKLDSWGLDLANKLLQHKGKDIADFFDPVQLADLDIKALPSLMKSFAAWKASIGSDDFSGATEEFLQWLQTPASKVTAKMQSRIMSWIQSHVRGYNAVWQFVSLIVGLKMDLKHQIDSQVSGTIHASLRDTVGHEGFVSVTPQGIVKLVNRAEFMKKTDEAQTLEEQDQPQGEKVVWTFMRANPPTLGHRLVANTVAQTADGGDYWIFLSHSQDAKKNPLDWRTKLGFVKRIMKPHSGHVIDIDNIKTPLAAANWLYQQGYRDLHMVVGEDRVAAMTDLMNGWNSESVRTKDGRDPVKVTVSSAGERDPDAEGISGISGTKARAAVADGDPAAFADATGLEGALANQLYQAVADGMQKKKQIKEKWLSGSWSTKTKQDLRDPPQTKDPKQLAAWITGRIKAAERAGEDPAYLLYTRNLQSVWAPLMMFLDGSEITAVRSELSKDPHMKQLLDRAPFVDHPSNLEESENHDHGTIVMLKLSNASAEQLSAWCHQHNINCIDPHDMHLTVLFSKQPVPQLAELDHTPTHVRAKVLHWKLLGEDALTLVVHCPPAVQLHHKLLSMGGTHSWPDYVPHVTCVYGYTHRDLPDHLPDFDLVFDLIHAKGIDPNFASNRKAN